MRTLDPDDGRPSYLQVADAIRDAITASEWQPGEKMPTRTELASHFGVAPMTVQNALSVLREDNVIVSRQGSGVFVHSEATPRLDVRDELTELRSRIEQLEEQVRRLLGEQ